MSNVEMTDVEEQGLETEEVDIIENSDKFDFCLPFD